MEVHKKEQLVFEEESSDMGKKEEMEALWRPQSQTKVGVANLLWTNVENSFMNMGIERVT